VRYRAQNVVWVLLIAGLAMVGAGHLLKACFDRLAGY